MHVDSEPCDGRTGGACKKQDGNGYLTNTMLGEQGASAALPRHKRSRLRDLDTQRDTGAGEPFGRVDLPAALTSKPPYAVG